MEVRDVGDVEALNEELVEEGAPGSRRTDDEERRLLEGNASVAPACALERAEQTVGGPLRALPDHARHPTGPPDHGFQYEAGVSTQLREGVRGDRPNPVTPER